MWALNCLAYTYYVWTRRRERDLHRDMPWSMPGGESVILNLLPLETQEVSAGQFNILDEYGWFLFVWPPSNFYPNGPAPDWYQTWMGVQYVKGGEYSSFRTGHVMANYNCFDDRSCRSWASSTSRRSSTDLEATRFSGRRPSGRLLFFAPHQGGSRAFPAAAADRAAIAAPSRLVACDEPGVRLGASPLGRPR